MSISIYSQSSSLSSVKRSFLRSDAASTAASVSPAFSLFITACIPSDVTLASPVLRNFSICTFLDISSVSIASISLLPVPCLVTSIFLASSLGRHAAIVSFSGRTCVTSSALLTAISITPFSRASSAPKNVVSCCPSPSAGCPV